MQIGIDVVFCLRVDAVKFSRRLNFSITSSRTKRQTSRCIKMSYRLAMTNDRVLFEVWRKKTFNEIGEKKPNWVWCIRCFDRAVSWQTKLLICRVFILVYRPQSESDGQTLISLCEWASGVCVWVMKSINAHNFITIVVDEIAWIQKMELFQCGASFVVEECVLMRCPRKANALFDQRWKKQNWRWKNSAFMAAKERTRCREGIPNANETQQRISIFISTCSLWYFTTFYYAYRKWSCLEH